MTDDQSPCGKASLERRRDDLIRVTEDPHFRADIYRLAYRLTGEKMDAEDCSQEAIARFISTVKNKTLHELERMESPLNYVRMIVRNICRDKWKKTYKPASQEKKLHEDKSKHYTSGWSLSDQAYSVLWFGSTVLKMDSLQIAIESCLQ
jgi:DNA-directed RNA polymerase specialized sigma24 family protein